MSRLSAARIATLKENGGMDRFIPSKRPRPGARMDDKWCRSRSGDCIIAYIPEDDEWAMWAIGGGSHRIAGDSSVARINAHWKGFLSNNS